MKNTLRWKAALLGAAVATTSCLGSNEEEKYAKLFDGPRTSAVTQGTIRGVWGGSSTQDDITGEWRVAFEADVVHVALRCRFKDNTRLTPGVSIPVTYGEKSVTFANAGEDTMKAQNGAACTVAVDAGTWEYQFVEGKLPMSISGRVVMFSKISD